MNFVYAQNRAKEQGRRLRLPEVTSWLTAAEAMDIALHPAQFLSDRWELEPRSRLIGERDARDSVKYALRNYFPSGSPQLATAIEATLDALYEAPIVVEEKSNAVENQ